MLATLFRLLMGRIRARAAILTVLLLCGSRAFAQGAPVSPAHPWHGVGEQRIEADAKNFREYRFNTDPAKTYSLERVNRRGGNAQSRDTFRLGTRPCAGRGVGHRAQRIVSDPGSCCTFRDQPGGDLSWNPFLPPNFSRLSGGIRPQLYGL